MPAAADVVGADGFVVDVGVAVPPPLLHAASSSVTDAAAMVVRRNNGTPGSATVLDATGGTSLLGAQIWCRSGHGGKSLGQASHLDRHDGSVLAHVVATGPLRSSQRLGVVLRGEDAEGDGHTRLQLYLLDAGG